MVLVGHGLRLGDTLRVVLGRGLMGLLEPVHTLYGDKLW